MIATGTDIKPIEIVMFMRAVKAVLFIESQIYPGVIRAYAFRYMTTVHTMTTKMTRQFQLAPEGFTGAMAKIEK